jgi:RimJ/RimL family protein N-acetyltransferase
MKNFENDYNASPECQQGHDPCEMPIDFAPLPQKQIDINTAWLNLRTFTTDDVTQDYVDWLNEPEFNRFLSMAGTTQTIETCKAWVRANNVVGIFIDGLHIGNITLDIKDTTATLGISIGRDGYCGKGFATEALNGIVEHLFSVGIQTIRAGVNINNTASRCLFERCGFEETESSMRSRGLYFGNNNSILFEKGK